MVREWVKSAIAATAGKVIARGTSPSGVRILLYHSIGEGNEQAAGRSRIPLDLFASHLEMLVQKKYGVIDLDTVVEGLQTGKVLWPENSVVITFDDGYRTVYRHALPILAQFGLTATVYVVAGHFLDGVSPDSELLTDEAPMSLEELRELVSNGWTVGSHTLTHKRLSHCSPETVMEEVVESRKLLTNLLGRPVHHFSYPHGDWTPDISLQIQRAGYKSAATSVEGLNAIGSNPWELRRIEITPSDNLKVFHRKLTGCYDWLGRLR